MTPYLSDAERTSALRDCHRAKIHDLLRSLASANLDHADLERVVVLASSVATKTGDDVLRDTLATVEALELALCEEWPGNGHPALDADTEARR